jgi:hypothetical protein
VLFFWDGSGNHEFRIQNSAVPPHVGHHIHM